MWRSIFLVPCMRVGREKIRERVRERILEQQHKSETQKRGDKVWLTNNP